MDVECIGREISCKVVLFGLVMFGLVMSERLDCHILI